MNSLAHVSLRFAYTLTISVLLCACASTTPKQESPATPESQAESSSPYSQFNQGVDESELENNAVEKIALGLVLREINQATNASLVLMNGLENILVPKADLKGLSPEETVDFLLRNHKLTRYTTDYYSFISPPEYELLTTLQLAQEIPKRYAKTKVNISLGADTPLFSALALIGHTTGLTLVADQVIGDSLCGELNLLDTPIPQAIEALVQSARIPPNAIQVRSTNDYIFLYSTTHTLRSAVQSGDIPTAMRKKLKKRCSLSVLFYTPESGGVNSPLGASKLHIVLSELSLQLGIPIKVEGKMNYLPVNPMVLNHVPREVALELIVHQWMLPIFSYEVSDGVIYLRHEGEE